MPSKVILIVIEFMFAGINMFHFMSLSRAQNIFMPANINSIVILTCYSEILYMNMMQFSTQKQFPVIIF